VTAPSQFKDLVGHAAVIARFRAAASTGRLGSAYLLFGEPGIGKRTLAVTWARLLQCEHPTGDPNAGEPCGTCRSAGNTPPEATG
jgi:DNA polymerase III gamma/tau subunit